MTLRPRLDAALLSALLFAAGCSAPPIDEIGEKEEVAQQAVDGKADWTLDPCERKGWYGDGSCDWFCPRRDPDCNAQPLGPNPSGAAAKLPIVLMHGFDASPTNRWGFYRVPEALRGDGHKVFVTTVPPYDSPAVRARALAGQIDSILRDSKATRVNLVAHSMGGLDARELIAGLGYGDRVASLTTISTPHRGSAVADTALKLLPGAFDKALNALATCWGRTYNELANDSHLRDAMAAISEQRLPAFNAARRDDPRVRYQSWAGVSSVLGLANPRDAVACEGKLLRNPGSSDRMHATLTPMAAFVAHGAELRPNDGMVTVESAKWGRFLGCIPADHLGEVGQVKRSGADPNTGFDAVRFYRNLAFDLAAQGF